MEFQLNTIGYLLIMLSLIHIIFPKYFNWKEELNHLSLINKQVMQIHTFFIALTVLLMGILCVTSATEIITTPFGKKISFGLGLFWFCRLLIQFFGYSSKLWKGKIFETIVHIVFSTLWIYLSYTFFKITLN
ncbi:hypothetical protein SAMN05660845_0418 [Flavobacterium swingsii]|jgi:hypothetical protein|uniref:Uncharacterized protein n=1 Tax=Flavobacterium swingsii TaxID=498292 RepID=A0A1I0VIA2_9FLAO|nr:hypothetical protein [Flavobacterium swingsii]SFA76219.1 hypothetical protein SAMN05660845_0418 [Flavobacterium swingsii]